MLLTFSDSLKVVSLVSRVAKLLSLSALIVATCAMSSVSAGTHSAELIRQAIIRLCPQSQLSGFDAQTAIPGSWLLDEIRRPDTQSPRIVRVRLALSGGGELVLDAGRNAFAVGDDYGCSVS